MEIVTSRVSIYEIELVRRLIKGEAVNVVYYLEQLKDPLTYFAREESRSGSLLADIPATPGNESFNIKRLSSGQ